MVIVNRPHIQSDLLEKSSHLKYVGIIIINTGITINVQLNSARVTTRSNDKRLVFELLEELSKSRDVANATEMAPAVAVTNPSIRNVPSDRDVKASAEAGASKKNTVFLGTCGNTTSHTAANAYPRTAINKTHINEWLVQSVKSLALESLPNSTADPEFKNMESV